MIELGHGQEVKAPIWVVKDLDPGRRRLKMPLALALLPTHDGGL